MNMRAPKVVLPTLPIEHFRCVPRAETLLRSECASKYARVAVTGRASGDDKHCSGCTIGAVHGSGHVPTHKAPAVDAPSEARGIAPPSPRAGKMLAQKTRTAVCEVGGHEFQCSGQGRMPRRCGEHRDTKSEDGRRGARQPIAPPTEAQVSAGLQAYADDLVAHGLASAPKRPPGRPELPPGAARDSVLNVRTSEDDRALIDAAAARAGLSTSEWARAALLGAAAITGGVR